MEMGRKALYSQRKIVERRLNEGFNVFANIEWIKLDDYFSTYGAGGEYEAVKVIFDNFSHSVSTSTPSNVSILNAT